MRSKIKGRKKNGRNPKLSIHNFRLHIDSRVVEERTGERTKETPTDVENRKEKDRKEIRLRAQYFAAVFETTLFDYQVHSFFF